MKQPKPSRVHPHQFVQDPDMPPDHRGRHTCKTCRIVGQPGDPHHPAAPPLPPARPLAPDLAAAAHARDAAILGEKEDEE